MSDTKLREWAREHLPERFEISEMVDLIHAGESLIRQCAEIAHVNQCPLCHFQDKKLPTCSYEHGDERAILRYWGMEGK